MGKVLLPPSLHVFYLTYSFGLNTIDWQFV
jgi:hypothetical protein